MGNTNYETWAKSLKKENGEPVTLSEHLNHGLLAFNNIRKHVNNKQIEELITVVIQLHDIGKVLPYFQIKILKNKDYKPFDVYANVPHSILSALMINPLKLKVLVLKIMDGDKKKAETYSKFVLSAIAYHHWRESFFDITEGSTYTFEHLWDLINDKKWETVKKNLENIVFEYPELKKLIEKDIKNHHWLSGLQDGIKYADYITPPYQLYRLPNRIEVDDSHLKDQILVSGFTQISDHFASFAESEGFDDIEFTKIDIEAVNSQDCKKAISVKLKKKIGKTYDAKKIWQFNDVEKFENDNAILIAPTGFGKTEFSFLWTNGEKFFYTLPLRAAVNQIFIRAKDIFTEAKTGLLHSDADIFIFGDGAEDTQMRVYDLARQLAQPVIISTGDQFFPYALRPPGYEKIFARFSYSRLIIDEVQAYDPKSAAIVVKFLEFVIQMGGKFLLMTATLPGFIRKEIDIRTNIRENQILNIYENEKEKLDSFKKHKIEIRLINNNENDFPFPVDEIINKALEDKGNRILVICNTVKQAQNVFNQINKNIKGKNFTKDNIILFHSRFTLRHKSKVSGELKEWFGNPKPENENTPKILVATQIVEASLDIDADLLFTEIAPMDALVQRMGRVLRRFRAGDKFIAYEANIYIISFLKGYQSGRHYVYPDELIRTTLKLLINPKTEVKDLIAWNNKKGKFSKQELNSKYLYQISEYEKFKLVNKLYDGLPDNSSYLKRFYNMLEVLDSGYMSDRKSEAQKIFREINDVQLIPKEYLNVIVKYINRNETKINSKYGYTIFKRDIISKYVVNVNRNKVQNYLSESNLLSVHLERSDEFNVNRKTQDKLKKWLWGIYSIEELDYSEAEGLKGVKEISIEDRIW